MPGSLPSVEELLHAGRLVPQQPDKAALRLALEAAERDVIAANANVGQFTHWADAMLYEAGLRCARAIVQSAGYRIDAGARAHVTAIDAADVVTGTVHHRRFVRLHRMRRRRNDFMYDIAPDPTEQDIAQARQDVDALIRVARAAVEALP